MEEFIKQINEKLPKDRIESGMIIGIVRQEQIKEKTQLLKYLQNQEITCREWLARNKSPTSNNTRREYARKLENIMVMKKIVDNI